MVVSKVEETRKEKKRENNKNLPRNGRNQSIDQFQWRGS
jgi:hypothetical protein